jgi:hypothetical protein
MPPETAAVECQSFALLYAGKTGPESILDLQQR